ncbi:MAG: nucleotidyltransferase family protein [SAR324 cluster bacterium]|nr:nucleotidyltransferase family protein [SAR324 cluster bacterium]
MSHSLKFNLDISAVVLAGGFGTRIRHLLPGIPKPMAPVLERPFLEWVVQYLEKHGIRDILLSTGYLSEVIEQHFKSLTTLFSRTHCYQEPEALGTGGGFLHSVNNHSHQPDIWLVLNGDSLALADLAPLFSRFQDSEVDGVILGLEVEDTSRYGSLILDREGNLVEFAEKRPGKGLINAGVYAFRHQLLSDFPEVRPLSFETQIFPTLLQQKHVLRVHPVAVPFLDIGTPETLNQAEAFIKNNQDLFA